MSRTAPTNAGRIRLFVAAAVCVVAFTVYCFTGAPSVLIGDSAELQAVANVGGVAHPSGYPTFILAGKAASRVLPGDPARRITIMTSLFGALAIGLTVLLALELGSSIGAAAVGSLLYGATFTLWWSAIRAEVYTLALALFACALLATIRYLKEPRRRTAFLASLFMGLTLTGHLAYAPAVLAMLMAIFWKGSLSGQGRVSLLGICALGLGIGLVPFAYTIAADRGPSPLNYLKYTIELDGGQFGLSRANFHQPLSRMAWLVSGREYETHVRWTLPAFSRASIDALAGQLLFEFGPLAIFPIVLGVRETASRFRPAAMLLLAIFVGSLLFSALVAEERMIPIFAMAGGLALACLLATGLDAMWRAIRRVLPWPAAAALAAAALCGVLALAPHALRLWAYDHPIGPHRWRVNEEAEPRIDTLLPTLRHFRAPRRDGEEIWRHVPPNSLVVGRWRRIMTLYYLRYVEDQRRDVALDPFYHEHLIRLWRWQEAHDPATHPIVLIDRIPEVLERAQGVDSTRTESGIDLYVIRGPIRRSDGPG